MATYWTLITYTRPNTSIDWFTPSEDILTKIDEFKGTEPKKIVHYETQESGDSLNLYYKLGFKDRSTVEEFIDLPEDLANTSLRETYCTEHNIEYAIDRMGESSEPSIPA